MKVQLWKTALSLSAGIFLGASATQANVYLTGGKIILLGGSLKLDPGVTFSSYSATNYVVTSGAGTVQQTVGSSAVVFPIGTLTSYSPITLSNSGTSDTFAVRVANLTNSVSDSTKMVNREWFLSEGTAGGSNLSATVQWNASDEGGSFSRSGTLEYGLYNGTTFSTVASSTSITGGDPYLLTLTGIATSFSSLVLGNRGAINGQILVAEESMPPVGGTVIRKDTFSSSGSIFKVPKGAQVSGDPVQSLTVTLPVAASGSKPATTITNSIDIAGNINLQLATKNPTRAAVTTGLLQLPPGTSSTTEEDGSISADNITLGGQSFEAEISASGAFSLALAISSGGAMLETELSTPEGTTSTLSGNQLDTVVVPESFTRSMVQQATLTLYDNGSVQVQTPILNSAGSIKARSVLHIPAGSKTSTGYTAILRSTFPDVSQNDGSLVTPSLTQNFDGEVEVTLTTTDSLGGQSKVILPKMTAGSEVKIQDNPDGTKSISGIMPLERQTGSARQVGRTAASTATTTDHYVGRDSLTNAAIYVKALADNTTLQIERPLSATVTTITVLTGQIQVNNGGILSTHLPPASFTVSNGIREFEYPAGISLLSFPRNSAISAADIEAYLPTVHSIWLWDQDQQSWQSYSPDLTKAFKLVDSFNISRIQESTAEGLGIFVYAENSFTLSLPDAPAGTLLDTSADLSSEWRLLGNDTDQPVTINDLLQTLPTNVLSLGRYSEGNWQIYSEDEETLNKRESEGVAEWPLSQPLAVGEAYWVQIKTSSRSQRGLLTPPTTAVP